VHEDVDGHRGTLLAVWPIHCRGTAPIRPKLERYGIRLGHAVVSRESGFWAQWPACQIIIFGLRWGFDFLGLRSQNLQRSRFRPLVRFSLRLFVALVACVLYRGFNSRRGVFCGRIDSLAVTSVLSSVIIFGQERTQPREGRSEIVRLLMKRRDEQPRKTPTEKRHSANIEKSAFELPRARQGSRTVRGDGLDNSDSGHG